MNYEYHNQIEHLVLVALDFICNSACLIGWISDTLSQGYTDLQSVAKCLDHGGIVLVLDTVCSQARAVVGSAMH